MRCTDLLSSDCLLGHSAHDMQRHWASAAPKSKQASQLASHLGSFKLAASRGGPEKPDAGLLTWQAFQKS